MKKLILVRHAKSSWDFPELSDFDRPLNARGERDAPIMAERFSKKGLIPDIILSSGAKRAYETAKVFADILNVPPPKIQIDNNLYHASEGTLMQIMRGQNEAVHQVMIFGHNPGLTDFANRIGDLKIDNLATCGIYGIIWPGQWSSLGKAKVEVFYYDFPKKKI